MSSPAVVCAPAEQNTATQRSSSSSKSVRQSVSCSIISGVYEFFLASLSTVMMAILPSTRIVTSPDLACVVIARFSFFGARSEDGGSAVDGEGLSRDVLAGRCDKQQGCALEVLTVADPAQRDPVGQRIEPGLLE